MDAKKINKLVKFIEKNAELIESFDIFLETVDEMFFNCFGIDSCDDYLNDFILRNSMFGAEISSMMINATMTDRSPDSNLINEYMQMTRKIPDGEPTEINKYNDIHFRSFKFEPSCEMGRLVENLESVMRGIKFDYYGNEFRELRLKTFLRYGEICAKCGAIPKNGISLTIDHIKPVSKFPELSLDENNLQVLCWKCNQEKSNKYFTDYRRR